MITVRFAPGFRISITDVITLIGGTCGAIAGWVYYAPWFGTCVFLAVGNFFLFCNVFRIARPLELSWAALFVALVSATLYTRIPGWPATFAIVCAATVLVIMLEMRKAAYHGILWRRINPDLPEWWAAHVEERSRATTSGNHESRMPSA